MPDTTASIAGKGCNATGITEELAVKLHDQLGKKVLAIVELVSEERGEKRNGKEKVILSILTIEPAPNADTENHLRELARSFYYERQLADGQLKIESADDLEPKVKDVLAAGLQHEPHDFIDSHDADTCDVCGDPEASLLHHVDDKKPAVAEADPEPEPEEPADPFAELATDEDPTLDGDPEDA